TTSQSPDQQVQQSTPSDQEDAEQRREDVRAAMATLPERHQVALEWKYVDRCSVRDIAERLDVTVKAAESILFRARKQLKDQLQKIDSDAETLMRQWRFDDDDRYADQRQGFDRGPESDQDRGPDRHQGIMPFAITRDVMRLRS
ncbi:MAG: sigma-70 family RNA polymerase sigma factor, partial [Planctomycetota bacterium]